MSKALAAAGEMGALVRSIDWAKTPLGPMETTWRPGVRTMAIAVLHSRFPVLLWWGCRGHRRSVEIHSRCAVHVASLRARGGHRLFARRVGGLGSGASSRSKAFMTSSVP